MEYLIKIGISPKVVEFLKQDCTDIEKDAIGNCMGRLESSILYLREIGVLNSVIEEILMEDYHVLMPGRELLEKSLSHIDSIEKFVSLINQDIEYMDYLTNIS